MPKINYQDLLDEALRSVAREALNHARINGLGENGCLHITFRTRGAGVVVPDFLKMRYPDTMTVVLQWTFSNLNVSDSGFGVTLTFDGRPFYIQIPFSEMTEFKDMDSEFMLQFHSPGAGAGAESATAADAKPESGVPQELPLEKPAERDPRILSMDEFRRKRESAKK